MLTNRQTTTGMMKSRLSFSGSLQSSRMRIEDDQCLFTVLSFRELYLQGGTVNWAIDDIESKKGAIYFVRQCSNTFKV